MSNSVKITSMRCPDCGGAIEPKEGESLSRCPYCNAVLHIEGIADEGFGTRKKPALLEKDPAVPGNNAATQKFIAVQWFDYIVLVFTVVGIIVTMFSTGNEIFAMMVGFIGVIIVSARIMIRGQIYKDKNRWQ